MASVSIRLDGVSKRFDHTVKGEVYAVRQVSLSVATGELLTLLGPSGCGKSTTLRMIAGFEEPDEGAISIDGRDVTHMLPNQRGIGFVFQNYALFPHLSIFENVAYGLRVQGKPAAEIVRAVGEVLELVGLAKYERQQPHQLSGGEQQRVALARAVVFHPKVLLFDEPLSNLDAKLRVEMREQIRALQKRIGITTVYVTHDQEEAMAISDRIAVMERGEVVQDGTAEDLYYRPRTEFVARFIGRTNLLTARVVSAGEVEVEGVRLALAARKPAGERVTLVVRPEMIALLPDAQGAGRIVQRTFLGEKTDYQVALGGAVLQVTAGGEPIARLLAPGSRVAVRIASENVHILS
ncbi:MAG: ABC transporter ATP-binding protein [Reyranella sp.]|uniref:ABC transporter ATP-binding protein n=1 Tax=Reyranella sp. TaxID=1929291 RepID=UPI001AD2EDC3|nr:ABC transporter ATP-binding protein [Reyranella sp.]MBN9089307.1 ABC transporter ATP-binding protein [Reyranella sp.]